MVKSGTRTPPDAADLVENEKRPVFARIEMPPGRGWVGEGIAPHDWSYGVEWVVTSHYGDEEGSIPSIPGNEAADGKVG